MLAPQPSQQSPKSQIFHSLSHLLHQCLLTRNLKSTKTLHACLLRTGFFTSLNLHTKLFLSYATCPNNNNLRSLTKLFKSIDQTDPLPWNAIVSTFTHNNLPFLALETFTLMHKTNLPLDTYALCSSLNASAATKMLNFGKQVHTHVIKFIWPPSVYVSGALIDLYAKSASLDDASKVFDEMPNKNIVCANSLLSGYANAKLWVQGLQLFHRMRTLSMDPDRYTLSGVLSICAGLSAIELGRQVHANLLRRIIYVGRDKFILSSLIEMYGKCGLVQKARQVFDLVQERRDIVLWTSMLSAYGRNGRFKDVIETFEKMLIEGVKPDEVAFVAVLSACSHAGEVHRGVEFFESMRRDFGVEAGLEHYGCLVDMLCRAGELEKAWKVVNEMPLEVGNGVSAWGALLRACNDFGNVEMGKVVAKRALELDPENVGIYVVLSNLYASFGIWSEIEELRELMKQRGLKKDMGCSRIEITK
ncbi:putative pentatricopeptide repeat-containing protein At3g13770, mitochondrial [Tasmannia lanceolata]|uniref:putative pentatricopeptide repeat-containing protein At3g13770, mitochondrial n=1 Tax=Tasmannia lanceolata TaxID=3420 RepID=UPI004064B386